MKTCNTCNQEKPLDRFPTNDGYILNKCKDCVNVSLKDWRRRQKPVYPEGCYDPDESRSYWYNKK